MDSSAKTQYQEYLDAIRSGTPALRRTATELASRNALPLEPLEQAVAQGNHNLYVAYLHLVREGYVRFEQNARVLATQYGYPTSELEAAVLLGTRRRLGRTQGIDHGVRRESAA